MDHLVERRRDESAEADDLRVSLASRFENLLARDHHAEVDDLEVVTAQHDAHDILADVVDVPFDGRKHDRAAER